MKRVGIFGGTFDPIHFGHLIIAETARDAQALDEVWFIPAAVPPHKIGQPITPFLHRLEMTRAAVAGHPAFRVNDLERDDNRPSYTIHTLETVHERHTDSALFLIIGSDSLAGLNSWKQPERIIECATLIVFPRRDTDLSGVNPVYTKRAVFLDCPMIDVSASWIRKRMAAGHSVRYLLPEAALQYAIGHGLYLPGGR
jgi:nicotinate-nucleotide adenylyltransferase